MAKAQQTLRTLQGLSLGEAALPPDVPVGFYAGVPPSGTLLGMLNTTRTLYQRSCGMRDSPDC